MIDRGKRNVLGVLVDAIDYPAAVERITRAAEEGRPLAVTALAVHGVMTGVLDADQRYRLNRLDLVTPDGQPVRWALNLLHGTKLADRVYGPKLTLRVCDAAARAGLPIYLYGSQSTVVEQLASELGLRFPRLTVAGAEPSKFRTLSPSEKARLVERIRGSGARITFVGLGCPRQEVFAYEYREDLAMPVVAVGAAFDYLSGMRKEPPDWVQDHGLQWAHRLLQEPGRLWKRYIPLNLAYLVLLGAQAVGIWRPEPSQANQPAASVGYA